MPHSRFPVTIAGRPGELRVDPRGLAFIPASVTLDDQLSLELSGWLLPWVEVAGIERVTARGRVASSGAATRRIRVHYDGFLRFFTVDVHAPLRGLFTAVDTIAAEHAHHVA